MRWNYNFQVSRGGCRDDAVSNTILKFAVLCHITLQVQNNASLLLDHMPLSHLGTLQVFDRTPLYLHHTPLLLNHAPLLPDHPIAHLSCCSS